jgi:hypothetical protein
MTRMAWLMVWHGWLAPMPQQPTVSLPFTESTVSVSPFESGLQQAELIVSQKEPLLQLVSSTQSVRQALAPHTKGAQSVVPGVGQVPCPSHTLGLFWIPPLQLTVVDPQAVVAGAKMHVPSTAQAVAPQGAVVLAQAALQQLPVPAMPQTPEVQASFDVQAP